MGLALALILLLLCLPAIGKDSGYFGCDFVDNKVSATYYFAPAKMAGIKTGDQIVAINKQPVTAQNSQTTLTMLKGEPGTKVKVTVLRKGQKLTFTVTRESLPQPVFVSHQNAQEYYIDGMRQLDSGYIPTARLALEEAESLGHKMAALSIKTLLPKEDPDKIQLEKIKAIKESLKAKQFSKAQKLCQEALKAYPQSEILILNSAYCARQLGQYKQALQLAQKLVQQNSSYLPGLIELAYCQAMTGQKALAKGTLNQALLLNGNTDELNLLDNYLQSNKQQHH